MKRRNFFVALAGTAAAAGGLTCLRKPEQQASEITGSDTLAGKSLVQLRDQYRSDLFDEFLPFMDKYCIDHELGGFLCNTDRDGTHITTNKRTWYEGRGIWVYSYIYNNIDPNPKYLEVARKSAEFILKTKPSGKTLWTTWFTREGKPIGGEDTEIYSDIFIAEGLMEYSKITGNEKYWDIAKELLLKCIDIYDNRPGFGTDARFYQVQIDEKKRYEGVSAPRILGNWMVFLGLTTQMLEINPDPELEAFAARCVDTIMNYHYNSEYQLINEYVNHDLSRIEGAQGQEVTGHVPETLWIVLFEALRLKDKKLFDLTAERFRRHVEVLWDDVYDGAFQGLMHVDNYEFDMTKALWVQDEILIGSLCILEHTGAQWAKDWFSRTYEYVQNKCSLKQHGFPLWNIYADRKTTFERHYNRIGNYHHPRELIHNLLTLERMIKKSGEISNYFS